MNIYISLIWKKNVQRICDRYITCKQAKSRVMPHDVDTPLPVPKEHWVVISMNFVLGLPGSKKGRDSIFVVVDRFSKMTHFISCNKIEDATNITCIFFKEIVWLHSVPRSNLSDWNVKFWSFFWKILQRKISTKLLFSTTRYPQTNGQTKVVIKTLTQLLRSII